MNQRKLIERINAAHGVPEGSTPNQITRNQQRAANLIGKLLVQAHRQKKRLKGKWLI